MPITAVWLTVKKSAGKLAMSEEIATRDEVLVILSTKAREGSISAAIALERALRIGEDDEEPEDDIWADLDMERPKRNGVAK